MDVSCRRNMRLLQAALLAFTLGAGARAEAAIVVSLSANPPSPAPVGTMVAWSAQVFGAGSDNLWYRFRFLDLDGNFRMIRDYGPLSTLAWTSIEEGVYLIEVSVRDLNTGDIAATWSALELASRIPVDQPVVNPTSHPLVFLFSSPGCQVGQARVEVQSPDGSVQDTPFKPCVPGKNLNFYLAGLTPDTSYSASLLTWSGRNATVGPPVAFQTGDVATHLPISTVVQSAATPSRQGVLLQAPLFAPPFATDLNGQLLWFGPSDLSYLTRPAPDGTFFGLLDVAVDEQHDVVRRFDLVGMTVQETNVARVNEQLGALRKRQISGFHHEARLLADGKMLVLGDVEQSLTDVQGPGPIDVIGDMILVLDADLRVVWTWDTFDHLDPARAAVLGETCALPGCAPHYLSATANDWTHGNAVGETPDGGLLYSTRHQDWLIKIDYQGGAGSGEVFWRLGKDGDFTYDSTDPYPWFSHQHDPDFEPGSPSTITLFDNGNTRLSQFPDQSSRGQAIELDEKNRTVRAVFSLELGVKSLALGAAQRLDDGTYHFDAGLVSGTSALSIQIDPSSDQIISSITLPLASYRSFRLEDLYGTPSSRVRPQTATVDPR